MQNSKVYDKEEIKIRRVDFNFDKEVPRFYYKGNPFSTHFINTLHILFPTGERFFVNSVLKYQKWINDEKLKKQIKNFCGQEGIHSLMHERFWNILKSFGYDITDYENKIDKFLHVNVSSTVLPFFEDKSVDLTLTVCLEHFTALFGHAIFQHVDTHPDIVPVEISELFKWHAAEEIEHKHVAFEVLKKVDIHEYEKRILIMPITTLMLYYHITRSMFYLLYQDRNFLDYKKLPLQFVEFTTGLFKDLHQDLFKEYFSFFKRKFHPSDIDDYYLAENFFRDKSYA